MLCHKYIKQLQYQITPAHLYDCLQKTGGRPAADRVTGGCSAARLLRCLGCAYACFCRRRTTRLRPHARTQILYASYAPHAYTTHLSRDLRRLGGCAPRALPGLAHTEVTCLAHTPRRGIESRQRPIMLIICAGTALPRSRLRHLAVRLAYDGGSSMGGPQRYVYVNLFAADQHSRHHGILEQASALL